MNLKNVSEMKSCFKLDTSDFSKNSKNGQPGNRKSMKSEPVPTDWGDLGSLRALVWFSRLSPSVVSIGNLHDSNQKQQISVIRNVYVLAHDSAASM